MRATRDRGALTGARQMAVGDGEAGSRLDRWFRRQFPHVTHGRLEKLLRTGQVRVDGRRAKAGQRLEAGQIVRVPPMEEAPSTRPPPAAGPAPRQKIEAVRAAILYRDEAVMVLNKPSGLAVQGGTRTGMHLDAMLDSLRFEADERPRLVHRLDRDTSGALVLARSAAAARALTAAFRGKEAGKLYWAAVVGTPKRRVGRIDHSLAKGPAGRGERMAPDEEGGKRAVTLYRVVEALGNRVSWLAMAPQTGRTHQLRVHAAVLGTPILGDGKYGGTAAFLSRAEIAGKLHLHARRIVLPHPDGGTIDVCAPLPPHMAATWAYLGFSTNQGDADALPPFET